MVFFFFFQAEDGIRDRTVTGVQTCALPISAGGTCSSQGSVRRKGQGPEPGVLPVVGRPGSDSFTSSPVWGALTRHGRSEERRVGKECRSGWGAEHAKKKVEVCSVEGEGESM